MSVTTRSVAIVTLGCTRNDVDSEELAGRLSAEGWTLVDDAAEADVAVVNTCGFIEQAKKDSIDAILEVGGLREHGRTQKVVAVGCLAERYGKELADELPEADAVLGFDSYTDMSAHLRAVLDGHAPEAHTPGDRRKLLPISPVGRDAAEVALPGHNTASDLPRTRLADTPWAPLKIASGCDRRCAFCAIPTFRGAFVSRRPNDVVAEGRWLASQGVRELFLVSENSTSYGKDLGDLDLLEQLLPELVAIEGIERVRVSYLQPAEIRPGLLCAMASTPGVVPWYDISFQHAAGPLLRRMRRFGDTDSFLGLIEGIAIVKNVPLSLGAGARIAEDTLVVYSTDNGPHFNEWPDGAITPFRSEKDTNWEGGFRVPCAIRWPGKIPAGKRVKVTAGSKLKAAVK